MVDEEKSGGVLGLNFVKRNIVVIIVLVAAALLRIGYIQTIPNEPVSDFKGYLETAKSIMQGVDDHHIAYQGPGYTYLLGYTFKLFQSNSQDIAKWLNVCMSVATVLLAFLICRKLTNNKVIIYGSTITIALLPKYIAYNNVVGTETISAFLLAIIIFIQLANLPPKYKYTLIGVIIGLTALVKPYFLAYPLVIVAVKWIQSKDWKQLIICTLLLSLGMIAVVLPWTVRNYIKYNLVIPVSYNGGYNIYLNNNSDNLYGKYMPIKNIRATEEFKQKILDTGSTYGSISAYAEGIYKDAAINWIVNNPDKFMMLGLLRLKNTFFGSPSDVFIWTMSGIQYSDMSSDGKLLYQFALSYAQIVTYVLSAAGMLYVVLNAKRVVKGTFQELELSNLTLIPIANILFFTGIFFVFEGQDRYNYPFQFLMVICLFTIISIMRNDLKHASRAYGKEGRYETMAQYPATSADGAAGVSGR